MERAVGKLEVALSDRCLVKTGVRYNFPQEALDRIESHVAFQVSDAWGVEWTVVYGSTSPATGRPVSSGRCGCYQRHALPGTQAVL